MSTVLYSYKTQLTHKNLETIGSAFQQNLFFLKQKKSFYDILSSVKNDR